MDPRRSQLPQAIDTARLSLTTPVMDHVPEMAVLANDRAIFDVLSQLPHPYDESHGRLFVETIARSEREHAWSILCAGRYIGTVSLNFASGEDPALGYWLGQPFWGQGYATEAAGAVVAAARMAGFTTLRSRARSSNLASRNVLGKVGFIETSEGPAPDGTHAGAPTTFLQLDFDQ